MSIPTALELIHSLEELGVIVQRDSDEALTEALEELEICEE